MRLQSKKGSSVHCGPYLVGCAVALPMLRRRGKTDGFHSFVPFSLFPTSSASSLADAYQALIFVN